MNEPEIKNQVECATCPWNRNCIEPPTMTADDVKGVIEKQEEGNSSEKRMVGGILATMVFGGKDTECRACPIFIERLRQGPELSGRVKEIMKGL